MRKRGSKNKGFTLVELIVVLVILAILAAILVPALLGWIDRSREEQYILKAREVVLAAQVQATEEYAADTFDGDGQKFITNNDTKIRALADMEEKAQISAISFPRVGGKPRAEVETLTYVAADGTKVLYDRNANPVYQIDKSGKSSTKPGAPTYKETWKDALEEVIANDKNSSSGTMAEAIRKIMENGELPSLEEDEKAYLAGIEGIKGLDEKTLGSTVWKPLEAKNLEEGYVLAAGPNHIKTGDDTYSQNVLANMVYSDGKYYMAINYTSWNSQLKVDNITIDHKSFSKDALTNAKSLEYYLEHPAEASGKVWVAL